MSASRSGSSRSGSSRSGRADYVVAIAACVAASEIGVGDALRGMIEEYERVLPTGASAAEGERQCGRMLHALKTHRHDAHTVMTGLPMLWAFAPYARRSGTLAARAHARGTHV